MGYISRGSDIGNGGEITLAEETLIAQLSALGAPLTYLRVNALGTGLEYASVSSSTAWGSIGGTLSNQTDLQSALDGKVDENVAITGATKTKITYDAKGLVTSGADATTSDIADSLNKRYVTDAHLTILGNTSGTNTGDNAVNTLYSGLVSNATHTGDATGSVALTVVKIQGKDFPTLGVGDDQKYPKYNHGTGAFVMTSIAAGGDVSKVGTPVDNQVGVWTGSGTIEGTTGFTYDGSNLQITGDIGSTGSRITKGWFTDLQVTNPISGSVTGNAGTVSNATFTTALTVNTGTLTLTANVANTSVLTIGAGAVSVSGSNTGDNAVNSLYSGLVTNATHTGDVTGSGALTLDATAITGKTLVTAVGTDYIIISDTSDSGLLKKALASDLIGGGGATNLTYTAATRVIASDTGTDATLPLMSSTDAGLVPASGGGTTTFLRADGTFAIPAGGSGISLGLAIANNLNFCRL